MKAVLALTCLITLTACMGPMHPTASARVGVGPRGVDVAPTVGVYGSGPGGYRQGPYGYGHAEGVHGHDVGVHGHDLHGQGRFRWGVAVSP